MATRVPPPPKRPTGPPPPTMIALRGAALGAWLGTGVATLCAVRWGHSPVFFLQELAVAITPLAALGWAMGLLATHSHPEPRGGLGISEAKPIETDELQRLLSRR